MPAQANATLRHRVAPLSLLRPAGASTERVPPIEPSETIEPSAPPSVPGQLYRGGDGSVGTRDETAARLRSLGINAPLHKRFPCVLPGHDDAARVNFTRPAGFWRYYCDRLGRGVGLAEVRAFIAYGHERPISSVEAVRWRERMDFEAHLRYPIPLDVRLPEPCPETARVVASAMRMLVGLRSTHFPFAEPFPFAHDFAQAYCGLSADTIRAAKDWLERAGVTYRAGKHRRAILWKLAAQDIGGAHHRRAGER